MLLKISLLNNGTIFFYFKETAINADNKFTLDFSSTELVYQINFSKKMITTEQQWIAI